MANSLSLSLSLSLSHTFSLALLFLSLTHSLSLVLISVPDWFVPDCKWLYSRTARACSTRELCTLLVNWRRSCGRVGERGSGRPADARTAPECAQAVSQRARPGVPRANHSRRPAAATSSPVPTSRRYATHDYAGLFAADLG